MAHDDGLPAPEAERVVRRLAHPPRATVTIPGSKSLTNRAILCAALARGSSTVTGALAAEDTEAMAGAVRALGATVRQLDATSYAVEGTGGRVAETAELDVRQSGTTARFVTPVLMAGQGPYVVDGDPQLRRRPMRDLLDALTAMGGTVEATDGRLPVRISAPVTPQRRLTVRGDVSSQFLSGLLLAGPLLPDGLEVSVDGALVSAPFVAMTVDTMERFGAVVTRAADGAFRVAPGGYRGADVEIEPDATAASYFFAAAAVTGGEVIVPGLGRHSIQGDLELVDLLARMGAVVERRADRVAVRGTGRLRGLGRVQLGNIPDVAPTLAVVAALAEGDTEIDEIGFVRGHESDRIAALVAELGRCGVSAEERPDGLLVRGGGAHGARVDSYGDHRIAMAFAVLGLAVDGVSIADPSCVAKTFPGFWEALDRLRA